MNCKIENFSCIFESIPNLFGHPVQSKTSFKKASMGIPAFFLSHQGKHQVKGLGFDATCSLVIQSSEQLKWDIIMWMDHRAGAETDLINNQGHAVLDYVGGKVSLEMQTPKLLWLKRNQPEAQCLKIIQSVSFSFFFCFGIF